MEPKQINVTFKLDDVIYDHIEQIAHSFNLEVPELMEYITSGFLANNLQKTFCAKIDDIIKNLTELKTMGYEYALIEMTYNPTTLSTELTISESEV